MPLGGRHLNLLAAGRYRKVMVALNVRSGSPYDVEQR
jgi:hypothetical protein